MPVERDKRLLEPSLAIEAIQDLVSLGRSDLAKMLREALEERDPNKLFSIRELCIRYEFQKDLIAKLRIIRNDVLENVLHRKADEMPVRNW